MITISDTHCSLFMYSGLGFDRSAVFLCSMYINWVGVARRCDLVGPVIQLQVCLLCLAQLPHSSLHCPVALCPDRKGHSAPEKKYWDSNQRRYSWHAISEKNLLSVLELLQLSPNCHQQPSQQVHCVHWILRCLPIFNHLGNYKTNPGC